MANAGIVRTGGEIEATVNARIVTPTSSTSWRPGGIRQRFEQVAEATRWSRMGVEAGRSWGGRSYIVHGIHGRVNDHLDGCDFRRVVEAPACRVSTTRQ